MRRFDFPLLEKTIFLDSGAGTLKPLPVIEEIVEYYRDYPINLHSVDSFLGSKVLKKVQDARKTVADLVGASVEEVIFTSGTTDSLNRTAMMFESFVKKGDKIIISKYNHSSNAVPWINLAKRTGAILVHSFDLLKDIDEKTKVVAYSQVNNTFGNNINLDELANKVEEVGAVLVNDAAQAIISEKVSLDYSDVIVFSGTKMYGPTGIGVLIIKKELLQFLKPTTFGGGTIINYDQEVQYKEGVAAFEAGTLNIAGIIGMAAGIRYMQEYDDFDRKDELIQYAFDQLNSLEKVMMLSKREDHNILFLVKGFSAQDVVSYLGHRNIILRAGKQCAIYHFNNSEVHEAIRISIGLYTNKDDIDTTVNMIKETKVFIDAI